jgi:protein-tyrosine phosphatase
MLNAALRINVYLDCRVGSGRSVTFLALFVALHKIFESDLLKKKQQTLYKNTKIEW